MMNDRLFRAPIHKDWIFWLALFGMFAGVMSVISSYSADAATTGATKGMTGAIAIDLLFAVGFQFMLFGVVPSAIRRGMARRREAREIAVRQEISKIESAERAHRDQMIVGRRP